MKTAIVVLLIIMLLALSLGLIFIVRNNDKDSVPDNVGDNIIPDDDSPFFSIPENASPLGQSEMYINVVDGKYDHTVDRTWYNNVADTYCADESFEVVPGTYEFYVDKDLQIYDWEFTCRGRISGGDHHYIKVAYLISESNTHIVTTDLMSGSFAWIKPYSILNGLYEVTRDGNKITVKFNQSVYGPGVFHSYGEAGDFLIYPYSFSDGYSSEMLSGDEKDDYYVLNLTLVNRKNNERYLKRIPIVCVDPVYGKQSCPDFSLLKNIAV